MTIDGVAFVPAPGSSRKRSFSQDSSDDDDDGRLHIAEPEGPTSPADGLPMTRSHPSPDLPSFSWTAQGPASARSPELSVAPWSNLSSPDDHQAALRGRTHFTSEQVQAMGQLFQVTTYPSKTQYEDLGKEVGVDEKAIKLWFQNRRAKLRKLPKAPGPVSPPMDQVKKSPISLNVQTPSAARETPLSKRRKRESRHVSGSPDTQYQTMKQMTLPPDHPFCNLNLTHGWHSSRSPSPPSEDEFLSPPQTTMFRSSTPKAHQPMRDIPVTDNHVKIEPVPCSRDSRNPHEFKNLEFRSLPPSHCSTPRAHGSNDEKVTPNNDQPLDFSIKKLIGTKLEDDSKADGDQYPSRKSMYVPQLSGAFSPWMVPPGVMPNLHPVPPYHPMMPYMPSSAYFMPYMHPAALGFYGNIGNMGQLWPHGMHHTGHMM